jgi:hypothetical protein
MESFINTVQLKITKNKVNKAKRAKKQSIRSKNPAKVNFKPIFNLNLKESGTS